MPRLRAMCLELKKQRFTVYFKKYKYPNCFNEVEGKFPPGPISGS